MTGLLSELPVFIIIAAFMVTTFAGFVKGAVGFAMPMIMISGISTFLPADVALAALIVPTLATNFLQAFRGGIGAAFRSLVQFRLFLMVGLAALLTSAQLYNFLDPQVMFALIGVPVVFFSIFLLSGTRVVLPPAKRKLTDVLVGAFAGVSGGISGVWGPPIVTYLTAVETPKEDQMRLQGVIYGLGAIALMGAHLQSGVLNARTLPFSVVLIFPAFAGMWLGMHLNAQLDAAKFRKATLIVLAVAGGNLIRRSLT